MDGFGEFFLFFVEGEEERRIWMWFWGVFLNVFLWMFIDLDVGFGEFFVCVFLWMFLIFALFHLFLM